MRYLSTRGQERGYTVSEAITLGLAPDGGLFVPETIPALPLEQWQKLAGISYGDLATLILRLFMAEYPTADIRELVRSAYETGAFAHPDIVPLYPLRPNIGVLELWHGPTCAFKDLPLQLLPHLMVKAYRSLGGNDQLVVLVSTSGDTGSAALAGFAGVEGTEIIVFYPKGGTSFIQERQMVTQSAANTHVAGITGNFDDAQTMVKRLFLDEPLRQELGRKGFRLTAANSINWGRLMPQIIYFVSTYLYLLQRGILLKNDTFNIVVPSGNFGHILAAYYAKRLGLPIGRLICASNRNNVLTDFIRTGVYDTRRRFYRTISPSMDILVSSNVERLLYHASGERAEAVRMWMDALSDKQAYQVDPETRQRIQQVFWADYATEEETIATINSTFLHYKYLVDPHTAVALSVLSKYRKATGDERYTVVAGTASPYKFCPTVLRAIKPKGAANTNEFDMLTILQRETGTPIPPSLRELPSLPVVHEHVIAPASMRDYVRLVLFRREMS